MYDKALAINTLKNIQTSLDEVLEWCKDVTTYSQNHIRPINQQQRSQKNILYVFSRHFKSVKTFGHYSAALCGRGSCILRRLRGLCGGLRALRRCGSRFYRSRTRATNFKFRTAFSAGVLPSLRHHVVASKINRQLAVRPFIATFFIQIVRLVPILIRY